MKRLFFIAITLVCIVLSAHSQGKKGFSFQGIARDVNGAAYGATEIQLRITLLDVNNANKYTEEHLEVMTDAFGVFAVVVGSANPLDFYEVDFSEALTAKIELARNGGSYSVLTKYELQAVPYSKHAETATLAANGCPPGTIMAYGGDVIPKGWLLCDGREYSSDADSLKKLYAAIQTNWGGTVSLFRVPDLRGMFIRGVSGSADVDPDRASRTALYENGNTGNEVGSYQNDTIGSHNHTMEQAGEHKHIAGATSLYFHSGIGDATGSGPVAAGMPVQDGTKPPHYSAEVGSHDHIVNHYGTKETRPENAYVYYIIKL